MKRRHFVKSLVGTAAASQLPLPLRASEGRGSGPHVIVVGAGAFGGWTALQLRRRGARVTLLDAWGAGNSRASSGGETRVIRQSYAEPVYVDMARRALHLWRESATRWRKPLYRRTGVLFMTAGSDFLDAVKQQLQRAGIGHQVLSAGDIARRYPRRIATGDLRWGLLETEAGYLLARESCQAVLAAFVAEGGVYQTRAVRATGLDIAAGELKGLPLADGGLLTADRYVFACGPWMRQLFADLLNSHLQVTRQEVFYFGEPTGARASGGLPVWADVGERLWYGIPGEGLRGFKIADDTRGAAFDPTAGDRRVTAEGIAAARAFLARRFPHLQGAPLLETRVCQYTDTPDHHFIADRHPRAENLWLLGGGSGHGFKHGPALGEMAAQWVLGRERPNPLFGLGRFST